MSKELFKTKMYLFCGSLVAGILFVIFDLIDVYKHIGLVLESFLSFILAIVLFVLAIIYPLVYKAELMIEKMEEEHKKK